MKTLNRRNGIRATQAVFILGLMLSVTAGDAAPRPRFKVTELKTLPGSLNAFPTGINRRGDVTGRMQTANGYRAFLYRKGVMKDLGLGDGGNLPAINDAGHIVVQSLVDRYFHCFLVTPEATIDLNVQTGEDLWPAAINNAGVIVGFVPRSFNAEACFWSNGVVQRLGIIDPNHGSAAADINNRGDIVGSAAANPPLMGGAAIFRNGEIVVLGDFSASALNDWGEVTGTMNADEGYLACLYRDGVLTNLGKLPGDIRSAGRDINDAGHVVGYSEDLAENIRAFFYYRGVMYDLNDLIRRKSRWVLNTAYAINDRGQIVGVGTFRGEERAFLLTPLTRISDRRRAN